MQKLKLRDRHFYMRIETNSTYMILLEIKSSMLFLTMFEVTGFLFETIHGVYTAM